MSRTARLSSPETESYRLCPAKYTSSVSSAACAARCTATRSASLLDGFAITVVRPEEKAPLSGSVSRYIRSRSPLSTAGRSGSSA